MLSPPTRDIIGISRHKAALDPSTVTLDFHGTPSQNGAYLNPTGIGYPEFVEINLAALQTPLIFAGEPWNMDRRLGPGGGCDGEPECDTTTPIGDPSMSLDPSRVEPWTRVPRQMRPPFQHRSCRAIPPSVDVHCLTGHEVITICLVC